MPLFQVTWLDWDGEPVDDTVVSAPDEPRAVIAAREYTCRVGVCNNARGIHVEPISRQEAMESW